MNLLPTGEEQMTGDRQSTPAVEMGANGEPLAL